jgi:hypothetical protein
MSEAKVIDYIREQIKKDPNHVPPTPADIKRHFGPSVQLDNLDKIIESEFQRNWLKGHRTLTLTLRQGEHQHISGSTIIGPKRITLTVKKKPKKKIIQNQLVQPVLSILADTPHRTINQHYQIIEQKALAEPNNPNFVPPPWPKHRNVTTQTADTLKFLGEVFGVDV